MSKKVKLVKEPANPYRIMKRMKKLKNKIKTVTFIAGGQEIEIEFEDEPTEQDKELIQEYFKSNPYWEIIEE